MKSIWTADIEFLKGKETPFFSFVAEDIHSDEVFEFYIYGEHDGRKEFFKWIRDRKPGLIGFNCLGTYREPGYDAYVLEELIRNPNIDIHEFYKRNNEIFKKDRPPIPEWKLSIKWLDLLTVWHFDNRARRTSLKWLMYMFDWPVIDEVEFDEIVVDYDSIERVLFYNRNDTSFTKFFYNITKGNTSDPLYSGKDKIEFRRIIKKEFGFDCLNWNDVKIGDRINKKMYCERTGKNPKTRIKGTHRYELNVQDCIEPYIDFKTEEYSRFFNWFRKQTFNPKALPGNAREIKYKHLTLSFGFGGLHSLDGKRILRSDDKSFLIDADVSSMYPAAIINRQLFPEHLGVEWYEGIKWAFDERITKWKPLTKKGDITAKVWSDGLKLAMNGGGFGKTNEEFSWQYDPKVTFSITLNNQFALMMLAEWLMMADITVLSVNTDGILCRVNNSQEAIYYEIMKRWEDMTKFEMEYDPFEIFVQRSISDYLAKKTNGSIKYKGDFEINKECNKNKSNRIIPIALKNYFIDDIPVEDTIRNHTNYFDFTIGRRARGSFRFFGELPNKYIDLPKTIRYVVTKDGWYFFKMEGGRRKHLEAPTKISRSIKGVSAFKKAWRCTLLNDARSFDMDNIDYSYYLYNTNAIISEIEIKEQLNLF